jgi:hypothetical protein
MVWVIAMIIRIISIFVPTKHTNNKFHMCLKSTCQNNKIRTSCYTKYGLSDFLLMGSWYRFATPISYVCSNPQGFPHHLIHLLGTRTHVHVVCRQFQLMSYLHVCASFQESTLSPCLKKGPIFLRCTKILSQCHPFLSFLPSPFLPCKNTFMDDYDGI